MPGTSIWAPVYRLLLATAAVGIALTGVACGGGDEDTDAPPTDTTQQATPAPPPMPKPKGAAAWSDEIVEPYKVSERDAYELGLDVCFSYTPWRLAREYGAATGTEEAAAHAYAQTSFGPLLRAAVEAGCLAGFRKERRPHR